MIILFTSDVLKSINGELFPQNNIPATLITMNDQVPAEPFAENVPVNVCKIDPAYLLFIRACKLECIFIVRLKLMSPSFHQLVAMIQ